MQNLFYSYNYFLITDFLYFLNYYLHSLDRNIIAAIISIGFDNDSATFLRTGNTNRKSVDWAYFLAQTADIAAELPLLVYQELDLLANQPFSYLKTPE